MKRSTMLALTGAMTLFLGACGGTTPKPVTTPPTTNTGAVTEEKAAVPDGRQRADITPTTAEGDLEQPATSVDAAPLDEDAAAPAELPAN